MRDTELSQKLDFHHTGFPHHAGVAEHHGEDPIEAVIEKCGLGLPRLALVFTCVLRWGLFGSSLLREVNLLFAFFSRLV